MRDIKFRVWSESRKKWLNECMFDMEVKGAYDFSSDASMRYNYKTDVIIEQFTGLIDKNGVEIYEGDIVKVYQHDEDLFNHRVQWSDANGCCSIGVNHCDYDITTMAWAEEQSCYEYEVIGNTHQHPELLEGDK